MNHFENLINKINDKYKLELPTKYKGFIPDHLDYPDYYLLAIESARKVRLKFVKKTDGNELRSRVLFDSVRIFDATTGNFVEYSISVNIEGNSF